MTSQVDALFEVLEAEDDVEARRLTTIEAVQAIVPDGDVPTDDVIERHIDAASAKAAKVAGLAEDASGAEPTFASEDCRATWRGTNLRRGERLLLPWRYPVTEVSLVTEDGVELEVGVDVVHEGGGSLLRLRSDRPACWSTGKIVVEFTAGWSLPDGAPPALSAAIAEQVKYLILSKDVDPNERSHTVNDLRVTTVNVPGGDSITKDGLLVQVDAAIGAYRPVRV